MGNAKAVIVVLAVVLLGAVGFIALETFMERENGHIDGRYGYVLSTCDSFTSSSGEVVSAPDGLMYAVAEVALENVDWPGGIRDEPSRFLLVTGGDRIAADRDTYIYSMYHDPAGIMPGERSTNSFLYLIPNGTDIDGMHIVYEGFEKVVYSPDLSVRA